MAYKKQKFADGQVLTAAHLNHIEDGIVELEKKSDTKVDWNADEGETGHILNRPFYSEFKNVSLLEQITLKASGSFGGLEGIGFLTSLLDIHDGTTCTVIYNGVEYICTTRDTTFQGIPCSIMGNSYAFGDPNTGEPFLVCAFSEDVAAQVGIYGGVIPMDGSTTFTISIIEHEETVTPIPSKYLGDIRGQKKYILDLDNRIMPSLEELFRLDTAELQSSLICIHEGTEKNVTIVSRTDGYYEGIYLARLDLYVPLSYGKYNYYRWDNITGFQLIEEYWTPEKLPAGISGTFMLVRQRNEEEAHWRRTDEVPLPGIVLSSITTGSQKKFLITVDDSGTLTATAV